MVKRNVLTRAAGPLALATLLAAATPAWADQLRVEVSAVIPARACVAAQGAVAKATGPAGCERTGATVAFQPGAVADLRVAAAAAGGRVAGAEPSLPGDPAAGAGAAVVTIEF